MSGMTKEFYGRQEIPREEIERMKAIEYPAYVSETLLSSIDLNEKKVLDAGAGPNPKLAEFIDRKEGMYIPLDLRTDVLAEMKDKLEAEKVPFHGVKADMRQLPFADGSFNVVHERFVLMNITKESRKQALEELMRVGKEKLVLLEYNWRTLRSTKNPEMAERFRELAFKLFQKFSTDPYMGEQLGDLVKEIDPDSKYSIQHFERKEDVANTPEVILNLKVFYNAAKNVLKDETFAADLQDLIDELEKSPIALIPPEIVAAIVEK